MDHGGQFENKGRVMSEVQVGGVDLCDNLRGPEALNTQSRNLNDTNALLDGGGRGLLHKTSLSSNGRDREEEQEEEGFSRGNREEDEEEDIDEVMKEEDEEVSEGSGSVLRCQSPDTPMTDSSYSETGSLLEAPYPFSPGTSPEPTSPVIPEVSPETTHPIGQEVPSQSHASASGSTAGPRDASTLTAPSEASEAKNTHFLAEHVTSSTASHAGPCPSTTETVTVAPFTTGSTTTGTESTSTTGPPASILEQITSSASTCPTGPTPSPAPLQSLEQLAQRGDDTHLPQYLHQIAEAFVLHQDYQRALCCIQLERLYHQRVLDNLSALQEQWESQCRRTSPELATQHLDTLRHICQTHNRPRAKDAARASLDVLTPPSDEGAALPPRTSAHQVDKEQEQSADDSHLSQGRHPAITPSSNLTDGLGSSDVSKMDGGDLGRQLEGRREDFHASELSEQPAAAAGGGGGARVGQITPVMAEELHPPTAGGMDQSKPAEPQGGDFSLAQKQEAKRSEEEEERDVEEAVEALEMEDEGEDEEEGRQRALPVETLVSGAVSEELKQPDQESPDTEEEGAASIQLQEPDVKQQEQEQQEQQAEEEQEEEEEEEEYEYEVEQADIIRLAASLDDMARLITVEEIAPVPGLVSILKKRSVCMDNSSTASASSSASRSVKAPGKRRVRFRVPDDGYEHDVGSGDSCLLLFLLCLVTVVISVGGTALYCALGDPHSSVCQDFSRNADFYMGQIQRGVSHVQHWFSHGS